MLMDCAVLVVELVDCGEVGGKVGIGREVGGRGGLVREVDGVWESGWVVVGGGEAVGR
jgi:hypothetical protein